MSQLFSSYAGLQRSYESVGTLCDEPDGLTCSYYVANKWGKAQQVVSYGTFEDAAMGVKNGHIQTLLVPAAYPRLGTFIMDDELSACETFIMQIPDLVVVGISAKPPAIADVLFQHPATIPLLNEVEIKINSTELVTSNSMACKKLLMQASTEAVAITNELCMKHYKLRLYKTLRSGIAMPWICFKKQESRS